jgi:hypothetical protein
MYSAIDNSRLDESLANYLKSDFVKSCQFLDNPARYLSKVDNKPKMKYSGIISSLKNRYKVRDKKTSGKNTTLRVNSSLKLGKKVHREMFDYVRLGKAPKTKLGKAVIHYFENVLTHDILASEVPVYIKELNCMTQVDLITKDYFTDQLHMWELKTGRGANTRDHGPPIAKGVPNTKHNFWQLQRHYSCLGLIRGQVNIKLENSHVIHTSKRKRSKDVNIELKEPAKWLKKLK